MLNKSKVFYEKVIFLNKNQRRFAQAYWLRCKPAGSDSSLEAEIRASRLGFKLGGSDSSLEAGAHQWLELLPGSLPKTLKILVLLVLFVFSRFYWFSSKMDCFIPGSLAKTLRI